MKFSRYVLFLIVLCSSMAMNPMGARLNKGFYRLCRGMNLGLTFSPAVYYAAQYLALDPDSFFKELPDASEQVREFCHEQLKVSGVNKPNMPIKTGPPFIFGDATAVTNGKCITIVDKWDQSNRLHDLLTARNQSEDVKKAINGYKATLQHEAAHVKHNDQFWRGVLFFIAPCIVHLAPKGVSMLLKSPLATVANPSIRKSLLELPAGGIKAFTSINGILAHSRYYEQRADNEITNDLSVLQECLVQYKEREKKLTHAATAYLVSKKIPVNKTTLKVCQFLNDPEHPLASARIAKLEQRITKLKDLETRPDNNK